MKNQLLFISLVFCFFLTIFSISLREDETVYSFKTSSKSWGSSTTLKLKSKTRDLEELTALVIRETATRLHVKIFDAKAARWEVPNIATPFDYETNSVDDSGTEYSAVVSSSNEFSIKVRRSSDSSTILRTRLRGYKNNAIEFETAIETSDSSETSIENNFYGLGERVSNLQLVNPTSSVCSTFTLFNKDTAANVVNKNLYGSHPFLLQTVVKTVNISVEQDNVTNYEIEKTSTAHGYFMLNSNAMDVVICPNSKITYYLTGGIIDFYVFTGPTPELVLKQYQEVVGNPYLPPRWSLGYHQSRWGYTNIAALRSVVDTYQRALLPLDAIWSDIDYMDAYKVFTFDTRNYPVSQLKGNVTNWAKSGIRYIPIVNPGIKIEKGYKIYDSGLESEVFIKERDESSTNTYFTGKVWPGYVHFPDWMQKATRDWWKIQVKNFYTNITFGGLWLDMNEPSSFCSGECNVNTAAPIGSFKNGSIFSCTCSSLKKDTLGLHRLPTDHLPGGVSLDDHTVDMYALHGSGDLHFNVHNLYGYQTTSATLEALTPLSTSRFLIISRSTFSGSGKLSGHWLGDNNSTYASMTESISGILSMNLLSVPFVGADICGFNGNATKELCARWIALGSFYPFARSHNSWNSISQEPYYYGPSSDMFRSAYYNMRRRMTLLPYYYSLFFETHFYGGLVIRPLFFEFPLDSNTYSIDKQMLIGKGLMITPVLTAENSVTAYFPCASRWYDFESHYELNDCSVAYKNAKTSELDMKGISKTSIVPIEKIPIYIRGGYIIPIQNYLNRASATNYKVSLIAALDRNNKATGSLFMDDGSIIARTSINDQSHVHVEYKIASGFAFNASQLNVSSIDEFSDKQCGYLTVDQIKATYRVNFVLSNVTILGLNFNKSLQIAFVSYGLSDTAYSKKILNNYATWDDRKHSLDILLPSFNRTTSVYTRDPITIQWCLEDKTTHIEISIWVWLPIAIVAGVIVLIVLIVVIVKIVKKRIDSKPNDLFNHENQNDNEKGEFTPHEDEPDLQIN
eukprot:TRINITY_DN103_c0_g2_i1.p1 TRINITY_DN103_c0_g2~~TRINITY_DN103_c0_g2_i1.p1  ORF type:complete len:1023 (-),score=512.06 TRINITY_DN103_c0_g2_i1:126-3194(-)